MHIDNRGAVLAGGPQKENQADSQQNGEQQRGLEARWHWASMVIGAFLGQPQPF